MQQRLGRYIAVLLYAAGAVGALWLTARFLLPWAAPFLVAYAIAALLEVPVRALVKRGWRRRAAAGLLSVSVLALVVWAAAALTMKGVTAVTALARRTPELMSALSAGLDALEERAYAFVLSAPEGMAEYLTAAVSALGDGVNGIPGRISSWALDALGRTAQASPDTLLFAVTAGIGTYFISASYPMINAFIMAQLPQSFRRRLEGLGQNLKSSFGGVIRAQLILMAMTFFELLLTFLLLEVKGAAGLAAVTALVDALPVFGTGIVLVPWALGCLLLGRTNKAVGLFICWAVVNLVRSCTQAKLLGDQIGLDPIASLLAVYVGWRVWRIWGMLLFPILLVTLQQLNDRGVIKLWKSV